MYKTKDFEIIIPEAAPIKTFKEEEVILVEGQEVRRTLKEVDLYNKVEEVWKGQKGDYSEAKVRLDYSKIKVNGQLVLGIALTNFKEFLGTNIEASKNLDYKTALIIRGLSARDNQYAFFSNMIGLDCAVETSDERVIVGLRSLKSRLYPGCWHVIAGCADAEEKEVNFFKGMAKELLEELLIKDEEINTLEITGINT